MVPTSLASEATEYLRRRLLALVARGPSIQSPMREHTQLEAIWSNNEVVEVPASPGVEDQSATAAEKLDREARVSDPLPIAKEKDKDVRSRLAIIAEQSKSLAELVLIEKRRAELGQEARETTEKA